MKRKVWVCDRNVVFCDALLTFLITTENKGALRQEFWFDFLLIGSLVTFLSLSAAHMLEVV